MPSTNCPSCTLDASRICFQNDAAIALRDAFPVTEGHTLVISRNHVASVFDLEAAEQAALWQLVGEVRARLAEELQPDGFNVGLNDRPSSYAQDALCRCMGSTPMLPAALYHATASPATRRACRILKRRSGCFAVEKGRSCAHQGG